MSKLNVILTLDYEIHGNGEGNPETLMVEPTARMMDQFDRHGAKLTIMAEVAEILKFREHFEKTGRDQFHYQSVASQLCGAIRRGHDVQLHLHPSYFNAHYQVDRWVQDVTEYSTAHLPPDRLNEVLRIGKNYLEDLLKPIDPDYECVGFRAGNWAAKPSRNLVRALVNNAFRYETSVFKYGRRHGRVDFDYARAHSTTEPWRVDEADICRRNEQGALIEMPIYSELRWIGAFLTPARLYRAYLSRRHPFKAEPNGGQQINNGGGPNGGGLSGAVMRALRRHAWKADFNQCSGQQLIGALERAEATSRGQATTFVLIGHSKLFTEFNERSLQPFLAFVAAHPERFRFSTFATVPLPLAGERSKLDGWILSAGLSCEQWFESFMPLSKSAEWMVKLIG